MIKLSSLPKQVGWIGQWLGLTIVLGGIVYEIHSGAHIGWIVLTVGAWVYTLGTKISHRGN